MIKDAPLAPVATGPAPVPGDRGLPHVARGSESEALVLVGLAAAAVGGHGSRVHCGITVITPDGVPETVAATDDVPVRVDWLQYELRRGPFIGDPVASTIAIPDLGCDAAWPEFARGCATVLAVRSMLSVPIPLQGETRALMNFYSSRAAAFESGATAGRVLRMASRAAPAAAALIADLRATSRSFPLGRTSRVGTALSIVMARERLAASQAFFALARESRARNLSLVHVASKLVWERRLGPMATTSRTTERRAAVRSAQPTSWRPTGEDAHPHGRRAATG